MPRTAPLIVFNHGWGAMDPDVYKAWIDHIVARGNVVVYPVYQDSVLTPPDDFTPNAIAALHAAIRRLQTEPGHVRPQLDRFALVGHSMGGDVSANMAALWKSQRLPFPRALMCVEPGKSWGAPESLDIALADLSRIPATTLLLTMAGDDDHIVGAVDARRIFKESTQVPSANKDYITLVSDDHGKPALHADHLAPLAWAPMADTGRREVANARENDAQRRAADGILMPDFTDAKHSVNALDYYGIWKLLDALTDAAFFGTHRNIALGNTPEQRFMGEWSDGVPVKELKITKQP